MASEIKGEGEQIPLKTRSKYIIEDSIINHELRRKLWDGMLPLKIEMSIDDLYSTKMPSALYIMAPRENYFYFLLEDVKAMFDTHAPPEKIDCYDEMWFSFNGKPLKWSLPIGVQFDTMFGLAKKREQIPWSLTFHYKECPLKATYSFKSALKAYQYTFINSLKESQHLRVGDAAEILSHLTQVEANKMVKDGLFKNNYETFWEINQAHLLRPIADFKRYAIRVLSNLHHTFVQIDRKIPEKPLASDGTVMSELEPVFKTWQEQQLALTVGEVLMEQFPALFSQDLETEVIEVTKLEMSVVCQGIQVQLETPIYWLQMNMCYPDGFLYLSFHFNR